MDYKDLFSCKGRIALVTGGAGLIGSKIAQGLRAFGAHVYIADIDKEKTRKDITDNKTKHVFMDITSQESVREAIESVVKDSRRIDILVNSAYPRSADWKMKFEEVSFSSWKENVNNQLGGYFLCCQIIAEQMKKQRKGSIINIGSTYGVVGPDFSIYEGTEMTMPAAYSAIKGGLINFTRYLATYYAKFNVRANCVSPGGVFDNQPKRFVEKYSKKTPLGRMAGPDEMVGAVVYLATDASSYVTGHNLMVDGGWTAW